MVTSDTPLATDAATLEALELITRFEENETDRVGVLKEVSTRPLLVQKIFSEKLAGVTMTRSFLIYLINNESSGVIQIICAYICKLRDIWLLSLILKDARLRDDYRIGCVIVSNTSQMTLDPQISREATALLWKLFHQSHSTVRREAMRAICMLSDKLAKHVLDKAKRDDNPDIRRWASLFRTKGFDFGLN